MADYRNYFTFSNAINNLLFKDVTVASNEAMFGLCIGVAVFTFLYEAIKSLRHYLVILFVRHSDDPDASLQNRNQQNSLFQSFSQSRKKLFRKLKFHCFQTFLHMLQLTMGYMLMLIVMSYNAWFIITVILTTTVCFYFHEFVLSRKSMIVPVEIPATNL